MFVEAAARELVARRLGVLPNDNSIPDINDDWVDRLRKVYMSHKWIWPSTWG